MTPLRDRLIVRRIETPKTGLIEIPDNAKEKPQYGKVLSVGCGKLLDNGNVAALIVKPDDTIIFNKFAGSEIKIDQEEVLILSEDEVLAIV